MFKRLFLVFIAFFAFDSVSQPIFGYVDNSYISSTSRTLPSRNDENIANNVRSALAADRLLAPDAVGVIVQSDNGVVTLTGNVNSSRVKSQVESKARSVGGVLKVINNVEVLGNSNPTTSTKPANATTPK